MSHMHMMFWLDEKDAQVVETALGVLMSESIRSLGSDDPTQTGDELIELMETHTVARALLSKFDSMREVLKEASGRNYFSDERNYFSDELGDLEED